MLATFRKRTLRKGSGQGSSPIDVNARPRQVARGKMHEGQCTNAQYHYQMWQACCLGHGNLFVNMLFANAFCCLQLDLPCARGATVTLGGVTGDFAEWVKRKGVARPRKKLDSTRDAHSFRPCSPNAIRELGFALQSSSSLFHIVSLRCITSMSVMETSVSWAPCPRSVILWSRSLSYSLLNSRLHNHRYPAEKMRTKHLTNIAPHQLLHLISKYRGFVDGSYHSISLTAGL